MSESLDEVAFFVVVKKFTKVFRNYEGGSKGCKNGWVSLQHRLLVCFFPYSFAFTLFDFFLIYEKFIPGFASFSIMIGALKASQRFFFYYGLLVSSTTLCAISTSFSFLLEQILFSLFSFA
jgi:hypothetical protein